MSDGQTIIEGPLYAPRKKVYPQKVSGTFRRIKWALMGVTYPDGKALPSDNLPASLLLPMGRMGPAFLAYPNFAAYTEWNNSLIYSTTAGYLASRGDTFEWARSVSTTSSIDFLPKFGIAASSFSDFITRSPIVSMPTRLRQLYERTPSSSSSIGKFSIPCASDSDGAAPSVGA